MFSYMAAKWQHLTSAIKTPLRGSTRNTLLAFVAGVRFNKDIHENTVSFVPLLVFVILRFYF